MEPATSPTPPTVIIQPVATGGFRRWFSWMGWMAFLLCLPLLLGMATRFRDYFSNEEGIQERYHSLSRTAVDKVAVIQAVGILAESDGFVKKQINRIQNDKNVKAIVLRVDSPGGTVTASDYLYHHLRTLQEEKKVPLVVSMGAIAASGGYYLSMAVGDRPDSIFAEPTTTTGSIGVIIPHYDLSGLLARYDIKDDSIVSHPRKQLLSMTQPASPEDRAILQSYVDQSFERFKSIVKSGRPRFQADEAALNTLATGEIFTATRAQEVGLVDRIGFIEAAIERAMELAELDPDETRVVTYRRPPGLFDAMVSSRMGPVPVDLQQAICEWSVPRAYYLLTTLPSFVSSP